MIITAGNLSESQNALELAKTNGNQNLYLLVLILCDVVCYEEKQTRIFNIQEGILFRNNNENCSS